MNMMTSPGRDLPDPELQGRVEIALAQRQSLFEMNNSGDARYFERLGRRIHDELLSEGASGKLQFFLYCLYTLKYRASKLLGRSEPRRRQDHVDRDRPFRVAVSVMGSLGDFLQVVPMIEKFYETFAPLEIDFFVHHEKLDDRARLAISGLPFVRSIRDVRELHQGPTGDHDLHIDVKQILKYHVMNLPRIVAEKPGLLPLIRLADKRFEPYRFMFDSHPRLDGLFARSMGARGMNVVEAAGYFSGLPLTRDLKPSFAPSQEALENARKLGLFDRAYITIHDGFEVDHKAADTTGRITRSWPLEYWRAFVDAFKAKHPDILVVQIGVSRTAGQIDNVDVSLVDKTRLAEAAWVIKHAKLHVDTEAGLIRVAWAAGTPAISLQGPSATEYFQIGDTLTVRSPFCSGCHWVRPDWMMACLRGFERAECMYAISPEQIAQLASDAIHDPAKARDYVRAISGRLGDMAWAA